MTTAEQRDRAHRLGVALSERAFDDLCNRYELAGDGVRFTFEDTDDPHGPVIVVDPDGDRYEVECEVTVRPRPALGVPVLVRLDLVQRPDVVLLFDDSGRLIAEAPVPEDADGDGALAGAGLRRTSPWLPPSGPVAEVAAATYRIAEVERTADGDGSAAAAGTP